ncbi:hypothetical protein PPERSA_02949 [Pseudocohnilembus persalinus]|uniref:Uncharacterized protein n=1 Tax=Pseudocohnilembus persalinus TaxID=266149 RepID=A0A0V0QA52_PSEPJ|nr:hypothetical protein PPERSA_02949 [Pseudocohnilembus persalinus]|eukprot:KRW99117.1 hypothetical protein PPERSA_02949 [Pseudocohnilembus persalinus]
MKQDISDFNFRLTELLELALENYQEIGVQFLNIQKNTGISNLMQAYDKFLFIKATNLSEMFYIYNKDYLKNEIFEHLDLPVINNSGGARMLKDIQQKMDDIFSHFEEQQSVEVEQEKSEKFQSELKKILEKNGLPENFDIKNLPNYLYEIIRIEEYVHRIIGLYKGEKKSELEKKKRKIENNLFSGIFVEDIQKAIYFHFLDFQQSTSDVFKPEWLFEFLLGIYDTNITAIWSILKYLDDQSLDKIYEGYIFFIQGFFRNMCLISIIKRFGNDLDEFLEDLELLLHFFDCLDTFQVSIQQKIDVFFNNYFDNGGSQISQYQKEQIQLPYVFENIQIQYQDKNVISLLLKYEQRIFGDKVFEKFPLFQTFENFTVLFQKLSQKYLRIRDLNIQQEVQKNYGNIFLEMLYHATDKQI